MAELWASFCVWISALSEADEILRSRAGGCVNSNFVWALPQEVTVLDLSLKVWAISLLGERRGRHRGVVGG